jgi:hypothetical protein
MVKKTQAINIDGEVWQKFKVKCVKSKLVMGDVLADLILEFLKETKQ